METRHNDPVPTGTAVRSPGKIFVGGLSRETTKFQFFKHFRKYGEIKDIVIMLDPRTGLPRGFGFVTYENPSVIDKVIEDTHVIDGKLVDIRRTIPKGVLGTRDFKTRRIFVSGIGSSLSEDDFKALFKQYGEIKEHRIVRGNSNGTNYLHGFGFITFDTEQAVNDVLAKGNKVELVGGSQILLHKVSTGWEPPPKGFFKLNSDGSSAINSGEAGAGGIIRNDKGQWIVGYSRKLGQATSTCAELCGVRDGLQIAVKRGLANVIVEIDSQVVLDLICYEVVDSRTLDTIAKECRLLLEQIPNPRLCQISRVNNSCADHLARMGATLTNDFVCFEFPPDCIKLLLFSESLEPGPEDNVLHGLETDESKPLNHIKDENSLPQTVRAASSGKIFIGGLARDITSAQFLEHFSKYGKVVDSVIMKNKETGQRRGFGFVTYADPSVVEKVIEDTHIINGKQVEIKKTTPKGAPATKDFNTIDKYREEPSFQYSSHHGRGNFGHFAEYGSVMDLYRREPSFQYFGHNGEHEFGRFNECHIDPTFPYRGEPSLEYLDHCGRDEFCGGMQPYWVEPPQVEFSGYGDAMELRGEEPFREYSSHSRVGFYEGYSPRHDYGCPSEIFGEHGAGSIARGGYSGGTGDGGARGGRRFHPYAW